MAVPCKPGFLRRRVERGSAVAHGGTLALDGSGPTGSTFLLALPATGPR